MSKGFTLIEAIIVVALVGVMMVVLTEFYFGTHQTYRTQNAELSINMSARLALDDIDSYVRQATQTLSVYDTYSAGPNVLILELQSVNSSNQLVPGTYDRIVYYLTGTVLNRRVYADAASTRSSMTRAVGNDITSLAFTYDNADYAQVTQVTTDLTIVSNTGKEVRDLVISSKSRLRN